MNRSEGEGGPVLPLFEINLIGEYADRLHRRRRMARVGAAATIILFVLSGALLLFGLHNVNEGRKRRMRILSIRNNLATAREIVAEIEKQEEDLGLRLEPFTPVIAIRGRCVAWAPKLAALGEAMPNGMSVHKIDGAADGILGTEKRSSSRRRRGAKEGERRLNFSVIYLPSTERSEDPIGLLLGRLRDSDRFMTDMDVTQLEASEKGNWDGQSVIFFRGLLRGTLEEPTP